MIVKGDVSIKTIEPQPCEQCDDAPYDCVLLMELRAIGLTIEIGRYCRQCAIDQQDGLWAVLPDDDEDFDEPAAVEAAMERT